MRLVSEVMRDALRLWEARRELHQRDIELLRQRWDEGKASHIAGPFDIERVIAKGKKRLKSADVAGD